MVAIGLGLLGLAGAAQASPNGMVISQVYGGGGNASAPYLNDFVELFNGSTVPVSVTGWSIQYTSATGTSWGSQKVNLGGTVQPGQYLLVQLGSGGASGVALPTADASGTFNMSASTGKVALVNSTTSLPAVSCPSDASIVDLVGYGTGNCFEGTVGPAPSNTLAVLRANGGCVDTDSNTSDFATGAPTPRNTGSLFNVCSAPQPIVPACPAFNTVQGIAGSSAISATDLDSMVTGASITGGAVAGITLGVLTPAVADGGKAKVRIEVAGTVPVGSYAPVVTFTNNESQSAACAVNISVLTPPAAVTATYTIQGTGATSPLAGTNVTARGVVTGVFPGLLGYYIQDEAGDGLATTSDGLFVFANSQNLTVEVGERVQVTGNVFEYAGFAGNPTLTEISNPSVVAKLGLGSIGPTPVTLPEVTEGDLERVEGMLVTIAGPLTVSQNFFQGRYGQVTLSAAGRLVKPTNVFRPNTAQALALANENARRRIVLDDGSSAESQFSGVENPNPIPYIGADATLRAGDTVAGVTGIVDFGRNTSGVGAEAIVDYKLHPTVAPVFSRVNDRTATPPAVSGSLKVASFNVLNYFTTFGNGQTAGGGSGQGCLPSGTTSDCRGADNPAEFTRQRDKIIRAIAAIGADVVGLMEIQRNGGVAAQDLVNGLNTFLAGNVYAVVPDPANVGTDAIQVAMIYKPASVALVGSGLSDGNAIHNRPPVARIFQTPNGARFSVIVNHFKSKGCDGAAGADLDQGDGQGCFNDRRKQQATALLSFIGTVQSTAGDNDVIVIGDLNAYAQEDPVDILVAGGLQDQLLRFAGSTEYSYVFDGEAGYLDHALSTASLAAQIAGSVHWHINADEPSVIDYNAEFKPQDLYAVSPYRSSDHDPVLVGLQLAAPPQGQTITFGALQDRNLGSGTFTVFATASSGLTVTFSSLTTGACSVSGTTVTLIATGTCTIAADQAGNATFAPAARVTQSFTVLPALLAQTISFGPLADRILGGGAFTVTATASSGLPVTFSSATPAACSVSGATVAVLAVGVCTVQADQSGNGTYASAASVQQSFNVTSGGTGGGASVRVPMPAWATGVLAMLLAGFALAFLRRR